MSGKKLTAKAILIATIVCVTPTLTLAYQTNVTPIKNNMVAKLPEDEAAVTQKIKELIGKSKTLSKLNIQVSTNDGVVTLSGQVDAKSQAISLIELAESVIGVSDVNTSKLTVKDGQQPMADSITTAKIKGLFIREDLFGEKDIASMNTSVETKDGVVYLTGIVDNKEQIHNAIDLIKKNIPEVTKVEYHVKKIMPANSSADNANNQ